MDSGLDACASPPNDSVLCYTSDESLATARRANHLPILRNRRHSLAPRNAFRLTKRLRAKTHFASHFNPITLVQMSAEKYSASLPHQFDGYFSYPASSKRGVRVVTNVEAGCDGRGRRRATSAPAADGEVVWSWHPDADAKLAMMRIKHHAVTVAKKPGAPRRARSKP
jgi:hypothetical protein